MNKDVITNLMKMITTKEEQMDEIKADHAAYAKLNLLALQMNMLQEQARTILSESQTNAYLNKIPMTSKKVPGTIYHLYTQNSKNVLSIVTPEEWDVYEEYHGAFLFDFDYSFRKI